MITVTRSSSTVVLHNCNDGKSKNLSARIRFAQGNERLATLSLKLELEARSESDEKDEEEEL
jgi:hypothetical protein